VIDQATSEMLLRVAVYALPATAILILLVAWLNSRRWRAGAKPSDRNEFVAARPVASVRDMRKRIEAALAAADNMALAGLYLDLARSYEKLGDGAARMEALRSAAGYGSLHGPHASHAAARLQLAEAAYDEGDLTGACEQWQMARSAFFEDGQVDEHERVDRRMRDNGCPTDWVLTDF
jgi:tetratricopeptide (TPR) repeat protein